ncbi:hypothetical protein RHGRI_010964 [Rhododendron griersonianum]|uniref:Uncharacterized protein n=1 Tax=Rhododendron griersonianum TaxID=479676 RepID=A0AAV6KKZ8_9ERIC|nr:hypothetical protein RHGRI_010964 [Rhododendron griersonianum]
MADGTISIADGLGLQALDRHYQRSHLTAKPQSISTSSKPENSSRLDLGADDSTTMLDGLGGKAVDSNEMRRKQRNPVDSAPTHGPHVVSTSSRSSPTMTLHIPFDLCPDKCPSHTARDGKNLLAKPVVGWPWPWLAGLGLVACCCCPLRGPGWLMIARAGRPTDPRGG